VTNQVKGFPFEVTLPPGSPVAVLSDQVKSLDWRSRQAEWICSLPTLVMDEVLGKLRTLLD
jgi:mRNA interferase MazF